MAMVGLRHPVFAQLLTETDGSEPTYGPGVVIGRAISADVEFTRDDSALYGDDMSIESDNSITGGSVALGTDDVTDDVAEMMLGDELEQDTGEYVENGEPTPYGGFGYVRVRRLKGATSYIAYWLYKTQFSRGAESAKTKGESIEWQTPTLNSPIMGVYPDGSGEPKYRRRKSFTTAAEAIAWVDARANIKAAGTGDDGQTAGS